MQGEKIEVFTWQICFVVAIIVFIVYIILSSQCVVDFMKREIPSPIHRIIANGLIIALIAMITLGLIFHYICPTKERDPPKNDISPFAFFNR